MDVLDATAPLNVRYAALSRAVAVALHIDELETINVCSGECSFTCRFRVLLQYRAGTMHGGDESERIARPARMLIHIADILAVTAPARER
jgi:hypothetical protein